MHRTRTAHFDNNKLTILEVIKEEFQFTKILPDPEHPKASIRELLEAAAKEDAIQTEDELAAFFSGHIEEIPAFFRGKTLYTHAKSGDSRATMYLTIYIDEKTGIKSMPWKILDQMHCPADGFWVLTRG
jgi:hypothetical protein